MADAPPNRTPSGSEPALTRELREEFDAAARRPLPVRFRYSFIKTYKPVLDDATYRSGVNRICPTG
jgi:hypothetical protein